MSAATWVPDGADIAELQAAAVHCRGCELWEPATQVVFSAGNPRARLALVGEAPGDVEDREGIPFVGPAGKLLQRALAEAGVAVAEVYVTNAVKHFRFTERGKRRIHATPQMSHIKACRPWLTAEIGVVDPELIVCLGSTAAKALLGGSFRVTQQRGQVLDHDTPAGIRRVMATVHPSSVLRGDPAERDEAFAGLVADLRVAAAAVGSG
jgi:uracil-DNA glycosylase